MKILAVNAGSSSLKFQLLKMPQEDVLVSGVIDRIGMDYSEIKIKLNGDKIVERFVCSDHSVAVELLLKKLLDLKAVKSLNEINGVGHRVVHGGEKFSDSVVITEDVIKAIEDVSDLAPLHNPANLTGIRAFQKALPNIKGVAVFDTAFHQTMNEETYLYGVPYEWYTKYAVRKYGFHGTSHRYVAERVAKLMDKDLKDINTIVLHLGNGASICAVQGGRSVDTTMGFTPLAGILMGTRSGDIDPAIVEFIADKESKTIKEVINDLNKKSGYLGLSQNSSDSRDLWNAAHKGDKLSLLAVKKQVKMICDYVAAYALTMGRVDAICFTAGVGENAIFTRQLVAKRLAPLGVLLDEEKNQIRGEERLISSEDSKIKVYLLPTNEEVMIARDTLRLGN
ncbi:Acetate kinase [Candidatus Izimaplasma bacterium HR1]|jgi:acetate kinase|uniref:acetate/propionate family kinase n=1 Tax=Candidatus Izimoplasma sp. HR1 TaxID=1541959 RepID=UPI0004F62C02|nr:Acetate kinase [Candidatus Izimaplasma bacterium HR1]